MRSADVVISQMSRAQAVRRIVYPATWSGRTQCRRNRCRFRSNRQPVEHRSNGGAQRRYEIRLPGKNRKGVIFRTISEKVSPFLHFSALHTQQVITAKTAKEASGTCSNASEVRGKQH